MSLPKLPPVRKRADYADIRADDLTFALFYDKIGADLSSLDTALEPTMKKAFDTPSTWHGWAAITKVDHEQQTVYGVASSETPDDQPGIWKGEQYRGDIVSSDAMREATPDYMQFANIREMHQPIAAGTAIHLDTSGGQTEIGAHIVDDSTWKKVQAGVLKGFSIGGKALDAEIVKIDGIPYRRITKLKLSEISLVDRPANSASRITLFKGADMDEDQIATEVADDTLAKAADPTKAIALLQQLRNDAENEGDTDAADAYTDAIRQVLVASGVAQSGADADDDTDDTGGDDSTLAMDDGSDPGTDVSMGATVGDLTKKGAMHSAQTFGHLQAAHDAINKAAGAPMCGGDTMQKEPGIAMADGLTGQDLAKALAPAFDGLAKVLEANGVTIAALRADVEKLKSQPAPGAPALRAVEKVLPGGGIEQPAAVDPEAVALDALRKVRDEATDEHTRRALADEVTKRELRKVFRGN